MDHRGSAGGTLKGSIGSSFKTILLLQILSLNKTNLIFIILMACFKLSELCSVFKRSSNIRVARFGVLLYKRVQWYQLKVTEKTTPSTFFIHILIKLIISIYDDLANAL